SAETGASVAKIVFFCQPGQRAKVVLFPTTISRFQPEKSSNADNHDADIQCMVDRKSHEVISKDQGNVDQCADAENQEMDQNADVGGAPLPKPDCALVLFEVDRLPSVRSAGQFRWAG